MDVVKDPDNTLTELFTHLVETHQRSLLHISYIYLKDRTLAEDAVQETFMKAYKSLPHFRGDCSEKTWLTRILINTCRDMNRSAWFTHMNRALQPEDVKEEIYTTASGSDELAEALWQLPAKYKEVILLYYYQNLTMPEIARALGVSAATVSRRIQTACKSLYGVLRKEGEPWMKRV